MSRVKVRVCTGKRCRACGSEALLEVEAQLPKGQREAVKFKDVGCLGYCGKEKHGEPPFVEVDDEVVGGACPEAVLRATAAAVKARKAKD